MIGFDDLEKLFSLLLLLDEEGRIRYASKTFHRYLPDVPEGTPLLDLMDPVRPSTVSSWERIDRHVGSLFLLRERSGRFAMRGQLLHLDGEYRWAFAGAPWLTWLRENRPQLNLGIDDFAPQDAQLDQLFLMTIEKRMVGELEQLNEALRHAKRETELAQEAKSALFARMSHEMRTPLNGVISALSLLAEHGLPEASADILRLAQTSSRNLMNVINYVLDLSRVEAGESPGAESIDFSLPELLEGVTDILRAAAMEKGLELRWAKSGELGDVYRGDKPKLRQCLLNLLTNAIRFTDTGRVSLRAMPSPMQSGRERVRIEVEDTGIGISAEDRKRIFQPFWTKAQNTSSGTGLGLDIVRRGVALMDGTVGVASAPGAGSVFWIDVPLEAGSENSLPRRLAGAAGAIHDCFSGRVLLVDDNATNLMLGARLLETMCVDVDQARSGEEALACCAAQRYQLVLMDISMPGMDGVFTTLKLRERFDSRQLPVVALTAYASAEEEQRCFEAGMNHYLTKPIVKEDLALQLSRFLEHDESCCGSAADEGPAPAAPADASRTGPGSAAAAEGGNGSAAGAAAPEVRHDTLSTLHRQIGGAGLATVVDRFRDESEERLQRLRAALGAGDGALAQREAHTLGSTCASIGLERAAQFLRATEASLLDGRLPPPGSGERAAGLMRSGFAALDAALAAFE